MTDILPRPTTAIAPPLFTAFFCKAETAAAKEHDFSGEWQKDGEGHYRTCLNEGCTVSDEKNSPQRRLRRRLHHRRRV